MSKKENKKTQNNTGKSAGFLSKFKNMTDTKAPKLLENMQDFYTSLDTLLNDFETTDNTIANSKKREG